MSSDQSEYKPIGCDFHDLLEAVATTRRSVSLRFLDEQGSLQHRNAGILDVYSRGGAEFVTITTGETVRLDRLVAMDNAKRVDY
jgi:Rho-binding antiterminator